MLYVAVYSVLSDKPYGLSQLKRYLTLLAQQFFAKV
jgi:hypothetical protein